MPILTVDVSNIKTVLQATKYINSLNLIIKGHERSNIFRPFETLTVISYKVPIVTIDFAHLATI